MLTSMHRAVIIISVHQIERDVQSTSKGGSGFDKLIQSNAYIEQGRRGSDQKAEKNE